MLLVQKVRIGKQRRKIRTHEDSLTLGEFSRVKLHVTEDLKGASDKRKTRVLSKEGVAAMRGGGGEKEREGKNGRTKRQREGGGSKDRIARLDLFRWDGKAWRLSNAG